MGMECLKCSQEKMIEEGAGLGSEPSSIDADRDTSRIGQQFFFPSLSTLVNPPSDFGA